MGQTVSEYVGRNTWTKETCIAAIQNFYSQHQRYPKSYEFSSANDLPSYRTFKYYVGQSVSDYAGCNWTKETCIAAIKNFYNQHQRYPWFHELTSANELPSYHAFKKNVGQTVSEYAGRNFWTKETCITALRNFYNQHQRYPKCNEFSSANDLPCYRTFHRYVGQTLSEYAGRNRKFWSKEQCLEAVQEFYNKFHRYPTDRELVAENHLPSNQTFYRHVGQTLFEYAGLDKTKWSKEKCTTAIERFIVNNGRFPKTAEMNSQNGLPCYPTLKKNVDLRALKEKYGYSKETMNNTQEPDLVLG